MSAAVTPSEPCLAVYRRPRELVVSEMDRRISCTYVKGHPVRTHSWHALRLNDAADMERLQASSTTEWGDDIPPAVADLLTGIADGQYDRFIEALLAVAHGRKRGLRGTPGFPPLQKSGVR